MSGIAPIKTENSLPYLPAYPFKAPCILSKLNTMKNLFNTNRQFITASRLVRVCSLSILLLNNKALAADEATTVAAGKAPAKIADKVPTKIANRITISSGLDYNTGDYGLGVNTNALSVPLSVKYRTGNWTYRLGTAYLYLEESSSSFLIDGNPIPNTAVSGLSDIYTTTRYAFKPVPVLNTEFSLTGKIKFGTANRAKGLGTGANEYTVDLGLYQPTDGSVDLFGSVGYRIKGDLPQRALNNVWLWSIGLSTRLDSMTQLGVIFDYRQATLNGRPPGKEVSLYWNWRHDKNWSFNTYGLVGLTNASPNFGAGLLASYSY